MAEEIKLTEQELEELKDTIKFRECVILKLKQLNGIPKEVWTLKVKTNILLTVVCGIVLSILGLAFKVLAQ